MVIDQQIVAAHAHLCFFFLARIRSIAVGHIVERPPLAHQPRTDVLIANIAIGDNTPVALPVAFGTGDGVVVQELRQGTRPGDAFLPRRRQGDNRRARCGALGC